MRNGGRKIELEKGDNEYFIGRGETDGIEEVRGKKGREEKGRGREGGIQLLPYCFQSNYINNNNILYPLLFY